MASKLGGDPIRSGPNIIIVVAGFGPITVARFAHWKHALLIAPICWHYHLCASL